MRNQSFAFDLTCASRAEGGAVGLALGTRVLVLDADALGIAAAVYSIVLAGDYVAADAGIGRVVFLFRHDTCLHCDLDSGIVSAGFVLFIRRNYGPVHHRRSASVTV